jgi:hypothetical protein
VSLAKILEPRVVLGAGIMSFRPPTQLAHATAARWRSRSRSCSPTASAPWSSGSSTSPDDHASRAHHGIPPLPTSPDLATPWLLQGTLRGRPARPPGPGTVPLEPDVWRLRRPRREHPAPGGSGGGIHRIHWLGRPDRRVFGRAGGLRAARWRSGKRPARHQRWRWRHGRAQARIGQAGRLRPLVWWPEDERRL